MLCTKHIIVFSHFSYCVVWWGVEPDKHYKKTVHSGEDNKRIKNNGNHLFSTILSIGPPDTYICYSVQQTLFHIAITIQYCPGGGAL